MDHSHIPTAIKICDPCRKVLLLQFGAAYAPGSSALYAHDVSEDCALKDFLVHVVTSDDDGVVAPQDRAEQLRLTFNPGSGPTAPGIVYAAVEIGAGDLRRALADGDDGTLVVGRHVKEKSQEQGLLPKVAFIESGGVWAPPDAYRPRHDYSVQQAIPILRQWLRECYTSPQHSQCAQLRQRQHNTELLSRVIEIPGALSTDRPRLRLTQGRHGQYVALSHCWGSFLPYKTTAATLQQNLQSLPLQVLPKTFQDAIEITRDLGIRYLWIDSLCIVQDDPADWQAESAKMITIFQNATLTLAATAAVDCRDGCCVPRQTNHVLVDLEDSNSPGSALIIVQKVPDETTLRRAILAAPLNHRAWVLQEFLLSTRVVHFAQDQLFWQCASRLKSENGLLDEAPASQNDKVLLSERLETGYQWMQSRIFGLVGILTTKIPWFNDDVSRDLWWTIAEDYSRRNLTKTTDRLPALAGLIKLFQERTGYNPLAGLWEHDLCFGLLWQTAEKGASERIEGLPSWSWTSFNGRVERCSAKEQLLPSGEIVENNRYVAERAKLVSLHLEWQGVPLVSPLQRSEILLSGRVCHLTVEKSDRTDDDLERSLSTSRPLPESWYFADGQNVCSLYARRRKRLADRVGSASIDYNMVEDQLDVAALEITFSSLFWDLSSKVDRDINTFHEVLLLCCRQDGLTYDRVGVGIVYQTADLFACQPYEQLCLV